MRLQLKGVLGFILGILPDLFNLAITCILIYTAIISCAPVFNDLMWSHDEGKPPPIRGTKWEDYDQGMQKILRTYRMGDVEPTGTHIKDWNRSEGARPFVSSVPRMKARHACTRASDD